MYIHYHLFIHLAGHIIFREGEWWSGEGKEPVQGGIKPATVWALVAHPAGS